MSRGAPSKGEKAQVVQVAFRLTVAEAQELQARYPELSLGQAARSLIRSSLGGAHEPPPATP